VHSKPLLESQARSRRRINLLGRALGQTAVMMVLRIVLAAERKSMPVAYYLINDPPF